MIVLRSSVAYFVRVFSTFFRAWASQSFDIEAGVGPPVVGLGVEPERPPHHKIHWAIIILPSLLTAAIDGTLVYVQVYSNFPTAFLFLNMAILVAFACFFVGWFINPKYMVATKVVVKCGVFFTYTAFFTGVTIPLPSSLKIIGWLIYAISLLAVLLSFKTELKQLHDQASTILNTTNTSGES